MSQNPSIIGFLHGVKVANPIHNAVTRGTVTVEVVTHPLSNAIGTICFGVKNTSIITVKYQAIMYHCIESPTNILWAPRAIPIPTHIAIVVLRKNGLIFPHDISEALFVVEISVGSAILVAKPIKNAKSKIKCVFPICESVSAIADPSGITPISKPRINIYSQKIVKSIPISIYLSSVKGIDFRNITN